MPSVQYIQKRAQIFYTRLQRQSDIILHFLYFSAPCRRFFFRRPRQLRNHRAQFLRSVFRFRPFSKQSFQARQKYCTHHLLHPAECSKCQMLPGFAFCDRAQPAGHIKACKNPKTQAFCIPLRHFFRKCIRGKKRCLTLQKSPVSHTVIWDIQKTVKNHLSVAQNEIEEVPPHTRRKTTKKWRKVSKKT